MGSFAIWGPSRADLDRLAWSIAESIDPKFVWIEMTDGGAPPSGRELEVLEEISLDRIHRMDRAELLLPAEGVVPGGRSAAEGLPPRLATRLRHAAPSGHPAALVLANLDRTLALTGDPPAFLASLTRGTRGHQIGLIATFGSEGLPMPDSFDCLVRVTAGPEGNHWNPTVDWSVRPQAEPMPVAPPPPGATSREVVRHLRGLRRGGP